MSASPFLTIQQLAARWHVSVQTLYNRRSAGTFTLPTFSEGPRRRVRVRLADVEAYERARTAA